MNYDKIKQKGGYDMNLTHTCLITSDVERLKRFYIELLQVPPSLDVESYVEFEMEGRTYLAIFDIEAQNRMSNEPAIESMNKSFILEFQVEDAVKEFESVSAMGVDIIKPLTTQSWGNTSFWFKDPDGNFLNIYSKKDNL